MRCSFMVATLVLALTAAACAPADNEVAEEAVPATEPAAVSLADLAGTWNMRAMREGSDSVVATYQLWADAAGTDWKMKFDNQPDTLPVRIVAVAGDSIMVEVGPYASVLRNNVMVTTNSTYRVQNGMLVGQSVAHYAVSTPDSVAVIRTEGTRAQ